MNCFPFVTRCRRRVRVFKEICFNKWHYVPAEKGESLYAYATRVDANLRDSSAKDNFHLRCMQVMQAMLTMTQATKVACTRMWHEIYEDNPRDVPDLSNAVLFGNAANSVYKILVQKMLEDEISEKNIEVVLMKHLGLTSFELKFEQLCIISCCSIKLNEEPLPKFVKWEKNEKFVNRYFERWKTRVEAAYHINVVSKTQLSYADMLIATKEPATLAFQKRVCNKIADERVLNILKLNCKQMCEDPDANMDVPLEAGEQERGLAMRAHRKGRRARAIGTEHDPVAAIAATGAAGAAAATAAESAADNLTKNLMAYNTANLVNYCYWYLRWWNEQEGFVTAQKFLSANVESTRPEIIALWKNGVAWDNVENVYTFTGTGSFYKMSDIEPSQVRFLRFMYDLQAIGKEIDTLDDVLLKSKESVQKNLPLIVCYAVLRSMNKQEYAKIQIDAPIWNIRPFATAISGTFEECPRTPYWGEEPCWDQHPNHVYNAEMLSLCSKYGIEDRVKSPVVSVKWRDNPDANTQAWYKRCMTAFYRNRPEKLLEKLFPPEMPDSTKQLIVTLQAYNFRIDPLEVRHKMLQDTKDCLSEKDMRGAWLRTVLDAYTHDAKEVPNEFRANISFHSKFATMARCMAAQESKKIEIYRDASQWHFSQSMVIELIQQLKLSATDKDEELVQQPPPRADGVPQAKRQKIESHNTRIFKCGFCQLLFAQSNTKDRGTAIAELMYYTAVKEKERILAANDLSKLDDASKREKYLELTLYCTRSQPNKKVKGNDVWCPSCRATGLSYATQNFMQATWIRASLEDKKKIYLKYVEQGGEWWPRCALWDVRLRDVNAPNLYIPRMMYSKDDQVVERLSLSRFNLEKFLCYALEDDPDNNNYRLMWSFMVDLQMKVKTRYEYEVRMYQTKINCWQHWENRIERSVRSQIDSEAAEVDLIKAETDSEAEVDLTDEEEHDKKEEAETDSRAEVDSTDKKEEAETDSEATEMDSTDEEEHEALLCPGEWGIINDESRNIVDKPGKIIETMIFDKKYVVEVLNARRVFEKINVDADKVTRMPNIRQRREEAFAARVDAAREAEEAAREAEEAAREAEAGAAEAEEEEIEAAEAEEEERKVIEFPLLTTEDKILRELDQEEQEHKVIEFALAETEHQILLDTKREALNFAMHPRFRIHNISNKAKNRTARAAKKLRARVHRYATRNSAQSSKVLREPSIENLANEYKETLRVTLLGVHNTSDLYADVAPIQWFINEAGVRTSQLIEFAKILQTCRDILYFRKAHNGISVQLLCSLLRQRKWEVMQADVSVVANSIAAVKSDIDLIKQLIEIVRMNNVTTRRDRQILAQAKAQLQGLEQEAKKNYKELVKSAAENIFDREKFDAKTALLKIAEEKLDLLNTYRNGKIGDAKRAQRHGDGAGSGVGSGAKADASLCMDKLAMQLFKIKV